MNSLYSLLILIYLHHLLLLFLFFIIVDFYLRVEMVCLGILTFSSLLMHNSPCLTPTVLFPHRTGRTSSSMFCGSVRESALNTQTRRRTRTLKSPWWRRQGLTSRECRRLA